MVMKFQNGLTNEPEKYYKSKKQHFMMTCKGLKKRLIKGYYGEKSHGGKRKYYTITEASCCYLAEMKEEW